MPLRYIYLILYNLIISIIPSYNIELKINQDIINSPMLKKAMVVHQLGLSLNYTQFEHNPNQVLLFYMSWCKHCKTLLPTFKQLSEYQIVSNFTLIQIECSNNQHTCDQFAISKYPTIKLIYNNNPIPFEPGSDLSNLLEFIKKIQSPKFILIKENKEKTKESLQYSYVANKNEFMKLYSQYSPIIFAKTNLTFIKCISEDIEIHDLFSLYYYYGINQQTKESDNDRMVIHINKDITHELYWDIKDSFSNNCKKTSNYLSDNRFPPMKKIDSNYLNRIKYGKKICVILFLTNKQYQFMTEELFQWAYQYKSQYIVTYAILGNNDHDTFITNLIAHFKIKEKKNPNALIYDYSKGKYSYISGEHFNLNELNAKIPLLKYNSGDIIEDFFAHFGLKVTNKRFRSILLWLIISGCILFFILAFAWRNTEENETDKDNNSRKTVIPLDKKNQ